MPRNKLAHFVQIDPSYLTRCELAQRGAPLRHVVEAIATGLALPDGERHALLISAGFWPFEVGWSPELETMVSLAGVSDVVATLEPLQRLLEGITALGEEAERIERFLQPVARQLRRQHPVDWTREPSVEHMSGPA